MKFRSKPLKGVKKAATAFKRGVEQATAFYSSAVNNKWSSETCRTIFTLPLPTPDGCGYPIINFENHPLTENFWMGWKSVSKLMGHE